MVKQPPLSEQEAYLSRKVGAPVTVYDADPVVVGVYDMFWTGVIKRAVVYKVASGELRAAFVPFSASLGDN